MVCADESATLQSRNWTIELGERVWVRSSGTTEFSFGGPGGVPRVLSNLRWERMKSNIFEFHAEAIWKEQLILRMAAGFGYVGGGNLRDKDFDLHQLDPSDPALNCTGLCSDTSSKGSGQNASYINADIGWRLARWGMRENKARSSFDVLFGYQRWKEQYVGSETVCLVDNLPHAPPGCGPVDPGQAITESFTYQSIRIGVRSEIELVPDLAVKGTVMTSPWTRLGFEDIHHFRGDFRQDPSYKAHATNVFCNGGWNIQFDAGIAYRLWRELRAEVGYQYWMTQVGSGTITNRQTTGDFDLPFNSAKTSRQGITFGINYLF
jgi:hypothetical protein